MAKPEPLQQLARVPRGGANRVAAGAGTSMAASEQLTAPLGEQHTGALPRERSQHGTNEEERANHTNAEQAERPVKESYVREVLNAPRFKVPLPSAFAGVAARRAAPSAAGASAAGASAVGAPSPAAPSASGASAEVAPASSPSLERALDSVPTAPPRPASDPAEGLYPTGLAARLLLQAEPVGPLHASSAKVSTAGIFDVALESDPGLGLALHTEALSNEGKAAHLAATALDWGSDSAARVALEADATKEFEPRLELTTDEPSREATSPDGRGFDQDPSPLPLDLGGAPEPAPLQTTPALLQTTPALLQTTPALLQTTPALLQTTPALLQTTPAPLQMTPALLQATPAPLQTTPAQLQTTPAQLQTTPAQLQTTPALLQNPATPQAFEPLIDPLAATSLSPFALSTEPQRVVPPPAKQSSWGMLSAVFVLVCAAVLALGLWYGDLNRPAPTVTESLPVEGAHESSTSSSRGAALMGPEAEAPTVTAEPLGAVPAVRFEDLPSVPTASATAGPATAATVVEGSAESASKSGEPKSGEPKSGEPKREPTPATNAQRGTLSINSLPASAVFINGRRLGHTPQLAVSLPPGKHRVTLQHDELGTHSMNLTVEAGKKRVISHKF